MGSHAVEDRLGVGVACARPPCPLDGHLRESVGVLVFVGVGRLAVDDADGVFLRSFHDQPDGDFGGKPWRSIDDRLVVGNRGKQFGIAQRDLVFVACGDGCRVGIELRRESRASPGRKLRCHGCVQFVGGVLRVGACGHRFAVFEQRVADEEMAPHQT